MNAISPELSHALSVVESALQEADSQIQYLHQKFTATGTGNAVRAQLTYALAELRSAMKASLAAQSPAKENGPGNNEATALSEHDIATLSSAIVLLHSIAEAGCESFDKDLNPTPGRYVCLRMASRIEGMLGPHQRIGNILPSPALAALSKD